MSAFTSVLSDVSFFECMAGLVVVGLVERAMLLLPKEMVGPGGWLLDIGTAENS